MSDCQTALKSSPAARRQSDGAVVVPDGTHCCVHDFDEHGSGIPRRGWYLPEDVTGEDWEPLVVDPGYRLSKHQAGVDMLKEQLRAARSTLDEQFTVSRELRSQLADQGATHASMVGDLTYLVSELEHQNEKLRGELAAEKEKHSEVVSVDMHLARLEEQRSHFEDGYAWVGEEYQLGEVIPAKTLHWYGTVGNDLEPRLLAVDWKVCKTHMAQRFRYTGPTTAPPPEPSGTPANVEPCPNQGSISSAPQVGSVKPGAIDPQPSREELAAAAKNPPDLPPEVLEEDYFADGSDDDGLEPQPTQYEAGDRVLLCLHECPALDAPADRRLVVITATEDGWTCADPTYDGYDPWLAEWHCLESDAVKRLQPIASTSSGPDEPAECEAIRACEESALLEWFSCVNLDLDCLENPRGMIAAARAELAELIERGTK